VGVDREAVTALLLARSGGVSFEHPLMLGRQRLHMQWRDLQATFSKVGLDMAAENAQRLHSEESGFAEPLLRLLGAVDPQSLDASDFEGSTLVHDLNQPVPEDWRGRYSLVWDGGTLEHVFSFPTALRNAMQLTRVGGHLITMSPANNWMGHGFFQFSPELWFRALSPENGFEMEWMLIKASRHPASRWYRVRDPKTVQDRVTATTRTRNTIYALARRTGDVPIFESVPMQSDYQDAWETGTHDAERGVNRTKNRLRRALNRRLSSRTTDAIFHASLWVLPTYDSRFFVPVDMARLVRAGPCWEDLSAAIDDLPQGADVRRFAF
jgi:hypothetical protein